MEFKGTALANTKNWIIKHYGEDKWREICDTLPKNFKIYVNDYLVYASKWYPFEFFNEINTIIVDKIGNGDKSIVFKIAKEGAINNFNTVYKIFIKIAKPSYIAKKAALIYNQFYNFGKMEIVSLEERHYIFSLKYIENYPLLFERIAGYMEGILSLTKNKQLSVSYEYNKDNKSVIFDVKFI